MGRFKTTIPAAGEEVPPAPQYSSGYVQQASYSQPAANNLPWPTVFPKQTVGLELEGVIVNQSAYPLTSPNQVSFIPGSLEAIKTIRMKGYRLMIITDQFGIARKQQTQQEFDSIINYLMQEFGKAGILSIDGVLYSTSDLKEDIYAKPNDGMFKRAQNEFGVSWKGGWFVGSNIKDLKAANKIGSTPVLLQTGNFEETERKLQTFANRELMKKTKIYSNLLEFANTLS